MTSFERWGQLAPEGYAMCYLCLEFVPHAQLWTNDEGYLTDVCQPCRAHEERALKEKRQS